MQHITYVGPVLPIRSGIAQHGSRLVDALNRQGDVTVLSWQHQYPKLLFRRPQRDPAARALPGTRFSLRWWDPISWWRAGRLARRGDALVITWTTAFHAVPMRVVLRAAKGTKKVAVVHNAASHEALPLQRSLTRWVLSRCDGAVTHAGSVADELAELVPELESVSTPLPPLIHVEPLALPPCEPFRLLFFGFVRPYKGLDVALDALAVLAARGVRPRLTVLGEFWGPVDPWQERVVALGLGPQVDLNPGYVPEAQLAHHLGEHHAVLLPYRSASQSGVAPIAHAAGRPVVAASVGGIAEVVVEGVNGTLAPPADPVALADAIERCATQVDALAAGAQQGRACWDDVAAAVLKFAGSAASVPPTSTRAPQLAYTELMQTMLDEEHRRAKARKILRVLGHFLGRADLAGLRVADIGCSAGYIADELASAGGQALGFDIDRPGLGKAAARFGDRVGFALADGARLPLPDGSVDVLVFNHIYEHVVDPDAVVDELHRVLAEDGVLYLGLGNRLGVMEPHYRLPFLSYLPPSLADRYVRRAGRGDQYYERFRTRRGLRRLLRGFAVWDYTISVIRDADELASSDVVPGPLRAMPSGLLRSLLPVVPTYIWVATKDPSARPAGCDLAAPPRPVPVRPDR